jgi:hypothetical protein
MTVNGRPHLLNSSADYEKIQLILERDRVGTDASQYYECLGDLDPKKLKEKLSKDPLKYTRFLNVFSRIAREIMNIRKYRDACARPAPNSRRFTIPTESLATVSDSPSSVTSTTSLGSACPSRTHHPTLNQLRNRAKTICLIWIMSPSARAPGLIILSANRFVINFQSKFKNPNSKI